MNSIVDRERVDVNTIKFGGGVARFLGERLQLKRNKAVWSPKTVLPMPSFRLVAIPREGIKFKVESILMLLDKIEVPHDKSKTPISGLDIGFQGLHGCTADQNTGMIGVYHENVKIAIGSM